MYEHRLPFFQKSRQCCERILGYIIILMREERNVYCQIISRLCPKVNKGECGNCNGKKGICDVAKNFLEKRAKSIVELQQGSSDKIKRSISNNNEVYIEFDTTLSGGDYDPIEEISVREGTVCVNGESLDNATYLNKTIYEAIKFGDLGNTIIMKDRHKLTGYNN